MQINLLPKQPRTQAYWTISLTAVAGIALIVNLIFAVSWYLAAHDRTLQESRLQQANAELSPLREMESKWQKNRELQRQVNAYHQWVSKRPIFAEDVKLFESFLPGSGFLDSLTYKGGGAYNLKAGLPSMEAVSTYIYQLKSSPKIASLVVKSATLQENEGMKQIQIPIPTPNSSNGSSNQGVTGKSFSFLQQLENLSPFHTEVAYADSGTDSSNSQIMNPQNSSQSQAAPRGSANQRGVPSGGATGTSSPSTGGNGQLPGSSLPVGTYQLEIEITVSR